MNGETTLAVTIGVIVGVLGATSLVGIFYRQLPGYGPNTIRVVALVLITTLSALLALWDRSAIPAVTALLGAGAGYVFGTKVSDDGK